MMLNPPWPGWDGRPVPSIGAGTSGPSRRKSVRIMKLLFVVGLVAALGAAVASAGEFIGADKCKMCHKVQYTSWAETGHAQGFEKLKAEDQGKAECLKCHATGDSADMPGVQCEACHGAGSDYKSMKVMKDPEASRAAGLLMPGEAECKVCHEGAPHDQKPFDYATAKETGIHAFKSE
jgi:hypothetical protein